MISELRIDSDSNNETNIYILEHKINEIIAAVNMQTSAIEGLVELIKLNRESIRAITGIRP